MIKLIFLREVLDQFTSLRFYLSLMLIIFLTGLGGVVYSVKYRTEVREYRMALTQYEQQLSDKTIDDLVAIRHPAQKPPLKLAFLADGGQGTVPNFYTQALDAWIWPQLYGTQSSNYRLRPLEAIDWNFVVRVVLSLIAFVIAYDTLCGEKQRGTLSLTMSYPVSRWQVLAGKFLAAWTCVAVAFIAGALLNLAIVIGYGQIELPPPDIGKVVTVTLLSLLASGFFVLIALFVSTLTHKATTSLVILLLVWVGLVVAVPGASGMLAYKLKPIPTSEEVDRRMQAIFDEIMQEYKGRGSSWRGRRFGKVDNYAWERISAEAQNKRYARQEAVRREFLRQKFAQVKLARTLSSISPTSLFQYASERLAGSGLDRDRRFVQQAWAFRGVLENYFRAVDETDLESPHIHFFNGYMSDKKADPRGVPRFQFQESSLVEGLREALWYLLLLGVEMGIIAVAAYFRFVRYDVR